MGSIERPLYLVGRVLLGLYFLVPGLSKVADFAGTSSYMDAHAVPLVPLLLVLTIIIQLGGGVALIVGYRAQWVALIFAGLTLVISLFMHDFWNLAEGIERGHEMQNFIKNLAIMAGLLCLAGINSSTTRGTSAS